MGTWLIQPLSTGPIGATLPVWKRWAPSVFLTADGFVLLILLEIFGAATLR
jgi:hypothetical protein